LIKGSITYYNNQTINQNCVITVCISLTNHTSSLQKLDKRNSLKIKHYSQTYSNFQASTKVRKIKESLMNVLVPSAMWHYCPTPWSLREFMRNTHSPWH